MVEIFKMKFFIYFKPAKEYYKFWYLSRYQRRTQIYLDSVGNWLLKARGGNYSPLHSGKKYIFFLCLFQNILIETQIKCNYHAGKCLQANINEITRQSHNHIFIFFVSLPLFLFLSLFLSPSSLFIKEP